MDWPGSKSIIGLGWTALLCLASAGAGAAPARSCSAPLRMAVLADWEPYNYTTAKGMQAGLDLEMSRAVFAEANCKLVEMGPLSSGRSAGLFRQGKIDLLLGASRTAEREPLGHFTRSYRGETVSIFTMADADPAVRAPTSFGQFMAQPGVLLALRVGWFGEDYARHREQLRKHGRLAEFSGYRQGLGQLASRRAPYLLGDSLTIKLAAARQGIKVTPLPFLLLDAPVYMMFSKRTVSPDDVQLIDAAIERLAKKGVLEKIRRAYAEP